MRKYSSIAKISIALVALIGNSAIGAPSSRIQKIFDPEMIGADVAYLEKITGPAKNTYDGAEKGDKSKIYKVDGCEVEVMISKNSINNIGINLNQKCTFDLKKFLPNIGKAPALHLMTFGQFDALTGGGEFTADCLLACGNAANPVVYEEWQASRADGSYQVQLGVAQVDGPVLTAASYWKDAMIKGEGEDWIIDMQFDCNRAKYNSVAQKAFKNVRIGSIRIGFGIFGDGCKK